MNNVLKIISFCCIAIQSIAQPIRYTSANAHSHNDYEQNNPFYTAYNAGFGSIEADVFLIDGQLLVGHEKNQLSKERTLESLYLKPLVGKIIEHHGHLYSDKKKTLNILIDCKTEGIATSDALCLLLKKYNSLISNKNLQFVISGNRPPETEYHLYPNYIQFDGRLGIEYTSEMLSKIAIISDYYGTYSTWNGAVTIPEKDSIHLIEMIRKVHQMKKPIRFWGSPDTPAAWKIFKKMQVDFINTDNIEALNAFLAKK